MQQHLQKFERALLRLNFRPNSITAYLRVTKRFLAEVEAPADQINREHIKEHLARLTEKGAAPQTRNQVLAAIRLFMIEVLDNLEATSGLRGAMIPATVPVVLSGTEVQALLAACRTPTHRALLMTLYAAGLRVNEACCLRINDVDSTRMVLRIVSVQLRRNNPTRVVRAPGDASLSPLARQLSRARNRGVRHVVRESGTTRVGLPPIRSVGLSTPFRNVRSCS